MYKVEIGDEERGRGRGRRGLWRRRKRQVMIITTIITFESNYTSKNTILIIMMIAFAEIKCKRSRITTVFLFH